MNTEEMMNLVADVEEGKVDPIKAYIKLYELEKSASELKDRIKNLAIDKREMYNDKEYISSGYKVSVVSTTRYSYRGDFELERLTAQVKNRQAMMIQAYNNKRLGGELYDENGEQVLPAEPKTSTYLKLEIQK